MWNLKQGGFRFGAIAANRIFNIINGLNNIENLTYIIKVKKNVTLSNRGKMKDDGL